MRVNPLLISSACLTITKKTLDAKIRLKSDSEDPEQCFHNLTVGCLIDPSEEETVAHLHLCPTLYSLEVLKVKT